MAGSVWIMGTVRRRYAKRHGQRPALFKSQAPIIARLVDDLGKPRDILQRLPDTIDKALQTTLCKTGRL